MTIQPGDVEKMRRALRLPDAMEASTGSDIDPEKAAALRRNAEIEEAADQAEKDAWEGKGSAPNA
jgi:hypothetical protein